MFKNISYLIIFIIVAVASLLFIAANDSMTAIDLFITRFEQVPVGVALIVVLAFGILLGLILGGFFIRAMRLKGQVRRLETKLNKAKSQEA